MAPRIAIIGAGPAGLTLARLLFVSPSTKDNFTVFESDASASARLIRGGTLDIHAETGMLALHKAGLYHDFMKHARFGDGEDMLVSDNHGKVYMEKTHDTPDEKFDKEHPSEFAKPEIDRENLKNILFESLPEGCIKWGHRVSEVHEDGMVFFKSGCMAGPFDLVVGAEGSWSKVRNVLKSPTPRFSGINGFQLRVLDAEAKHPDIAKRIGGGSHFVYGDCKAIQGQKLGDGSYLNSLWLANEDESWSKDIGKKYKTEPEKIKSILLEKYWNYIPDFRLWIAKSDPSTILPWTLYEIPSEDDGPRWTHKKGFTLIGDAAHVMTVFAGKGVNMGMQDALELSQEIVAAAEKEGEDDGSELDAAVVRYEKKMWPQASEAMKETDFFKRCMFHPKAPGPFVGPWKEKIKDEEAMPIKQMSFTEEPTGVGLIRRRSTGNID